MKLLDGVTADASLSPDGVYRYVLTRDWWPKREGHVLWVMLNPSTADADTDDMTARKCQQFARRWGYDGITICNLFALRSRNPRVLLRHPDPIGPVNDDIIDTLATAAGTGLVVCAWGNGGVIQSRGALVAARLRELGASPQRLGTLTGVEQPRHPLLLPYTLAPEDL